MNAASTVQEQYLLFNACEEIVMGAVRDMMKSTDMCQCEKCFKDVCAIVLNRMPPHYVTSQAGALFSRLPNMPIEQNTDLIVNVVRAIEIVSKGPKH